MNHSEMTCNPSSESRTSPLWASSPPNCYNLSTYPDSNSPLTLEPVDPGEQWPPTYPYTLGQPFPFSLSYQQPPIAYNRCTSLIPSDPSAPNSFLQPPLHSVLPDTIPQQLITPNWETGLLIDGQLALIALVPPSDADRLLILPLGLPPASDSSNSLEDLDSAQIDMLNAILNTPVSSPNLTNGSHSGPSISDTMPDLPEVQHLYYGVPILG
jgi:hypothetical protein